jgi:hypothetical protein
MKFRNTGLAVRSVKAIFTMIGAIPLMKGGGAVKLGQSRRCTASTRLIYLPSVL